MKPKFTVIDIKTDLARLRQVGLKCAEYYLQAELARRQASALNSGRPRTHDSPRHERMRKASAAWRAKQKESLGLLPTTGTSKVEDL